MNSEVRLVSLWASFDSEHKILELIVKVLGFRNKENLAEEKDDVVNRASEAPLALRLPSTSLRRQRADSGEPRGRLRLPGVGGGGGGRAAEDAVPGRQRLRDFERVLLVSGLDT